MNKIRVKGGAPLARHNSATKKGFDPQGISVRTEKARPFMSETPSLQKMVRLAFKLFKLLPRPANENSSLNEDLRIAMPIPADENPEWLLQFHG
jgi:hypothetical protein